MERPPTPSRWWLISVLAVAASGGFAGDHLAPWRESPREAWAAISRAAAAGDYGAVWDRFDPASQQRFAARLRAFAEQHAPDRAAGMTDRSDPMRPTPVPGRTSPGALRSFTSMAPTRAMSRW